MPTNQQLDNGELRSLALGYDKLTGELSSDLRYVNGSNMLVTNFGKLCKRPGTNLLSSMNSFGSPLFVDHFIFYETLDSPPKRWIVASVNNSGTYEVWAMQATVAVSTVQKIPTLRSIHSSRYPHEFCVSRGLCFIKAFPLGANDTLGTVVFDGSKTLNPSDAGTVTFWGLIGPTTPAALTGSMSAGVFTASGWGTATLPVTVNYGWGYTYTYKTITGQESSRAPVQTDSSQLPSYTGSFTNQCPKMTLTGHSDTVNVPTLVVYRTTDGGGNFLKVEEIANTGGSITYFDQHFPDGLTVASQPYPDSYLDTTLIAPSLTTNSPPPSVTASSTVWATINGAITAAATSILLNLNFNGSVVNLTTLPTYAITIDNEVMLDTGGSGGGGITPYTLTVTRAQNGTKAITHASGATVKLTPIVGMDTPARSTPIASYAGRFWYGINNVLFYSGQEEISAGVPEECWPSGGRGNFFRFNHPIVNVYATSEALYILTTEDTHWLKGSTRDTFQVQRLFSDLGARIGHPRAICAADKSIIFLTHDLRICMARGQKREFLSDLLGTDLKTAVKTNGCVIHLERYAEFEKDWLIVLASNTTTIANCQQWVYDFNQGDQGLWNVPWTIQASAIQGGFPFATTDDPSRYLVCSSVGTSGNTQCILTIVDMSLATVQDYITQGSGSGLNNYACSATISMVRNPTGNHINTLRLPGMVSILEHVKVDRTTFTSDNDPTVTYWLDDSTQSGGTAITAIENPPRRVQSNGYKTLFYEVDSVCERVQIKISKPSANERFELQQIAFAWNPDEGA